MDRVIELHETSKIGLAPMEGTTDFPTRFWMSLVGAPGSMGTPFLRVTNSFPKDEVDAKLWPELYLSSENLPYRLVPQLMVSSSDDFLRVAPAVLDRTDVIELNCGCPSSRVVGKGSGSSILLEPHEFASRVERLCRGLGPGRLSVKMRLGFHGEEEFGDLVAAMKGLPIARLVIHGRTRQQRYLGSANWHRIEDAARMLDVPVCGSGDIVDQESLQEKLSTAPSVHEVIVGRGALRNPWIFSEFEAGQPSLLSRDMIPFLLGAFAIQQYLYAEDWPRLCDFWEAEKQTQCGKSLEDWSAYYARLSEAAFCTYVAPTALELPRYTVNRTKMIWSYMRSSFPQAAMDPAPLRERSLAGMLRAIAAILPDEFETDYRNECDWMYAGEKKPPNQKH